MDWIGLGTRRESPKNETDTGSSGAAGTGLLRPISEGGNVIKAPSSAKISSTRSSPLQSQSIDGKQTASWQQEKVAFEKRIVDLEAKNSQLEGLLGDERGLSSKLLKRLESGH